MSQERAWQAAVDAYQIEADAISYALGGIERESFLSAVAALKRAPRIASSGCGHSGICCQHFAHLMCCIERPARFISPAEAVHGASGYLQQGDVMLLASRGGKTAELLPILDICKSKGVTVISVTENLESPLAKGADIVLQMRVTKTVGRNSAAQRAAGMADTSPYTRSNCTHAAVAEARASTYCVRAPINVR